MSRKYRITNHCSSILNTLNDFRHTGSFCDTTLVVNDEPLHIHKAVLVALSTYFTVLFGDNFQESHKAEIIMNGDEYKGLKDIINFAYTAEIELNEENVDYIMEAADLFQINSLRPYICQFIKSTLRIDTCLGIHAKATLRNYKELANDAFIYFLENFQHAIENSDSGIADLSEDMWISVLKSDVLNVKDEGVLLNAIIKWYASSPSNRLASLTNIFTYINVTKVDAVILNEYAAIQSHNELQLRNTVGAITSQDVTTSQNIESKMKDLKYPTRVRPIRCTKHDLAIIATGGAGTSSVECYTKDTEAWSFHVPDWSLYEPFRNNDTVIPNWICHDGMASASRGRELYVIGGKDVAKLLRYNVVRNSWETLAELPDSLQLSFPSAAFCNGALYVSGGCDQVDVVTKCVLMYLESADGVGHWKYVSPMNEKRMGHQLCNVNGILYAVGGVKERSQAYSSVERYCPFSDSWSYVAHMLTSRCFFGATVLNEYIYVAGGYQERGKFLNDSERYNTLLDRWEPLPSMPTSRAYCSCTEFKGRIFVIGGHDIDKSVTKTVYNYNPKRRWWDIIQPMHFNRRCPLVATLLIPVDPTKQNENVRTVYNQYRL